MTEKQQKRLVWLELFHYGIRPSLDTKNKITKLLLSSKVRRMK